MALTERYGFRKTLFGRMVLQVEEEFRSFWSHFAKEPVLKRRWRDAKVLDLTAVELRPLMDMRNRPGYMPWLYRSPPAAQPSPRDDASPDPAFAQPNGKDDLERTVVH
ncbi:hypothetical protein [Microvirga massiliensis]|uniref:hypothetical protein n=1 Tax=Microvirga massiliensis TaxID=1033741 RepID=UPI00069B6346|nr:hypothetical protein [Microvirga massiliensis]